MKEIVLIKNNNSYKRADDYFNNIDTEKKAYLLGFFLADGYIDNNRIRVQNSIDDLEIIKIFKDELSPNSEICYTNKQTGAKFRKPQCSMGVTSKQMVETLNKYGIIANKTYNKEFFFDFNIIPKNLQKHFIRGYFDGDGSISFHKNNHNTIFFNFSFVFNSKAFTDQIANIFKDLFQITPVIYHNIGKTTDWFALRFNYNRNRYNKIKEIYNYLYQDSTIFLSRKKIKFEKYIEYRANSINNIIEQCNA